ncbi:MAG: 5-guanidino-2-oxopentanoate decarboxylase [Granulosicoccus sp.]|nr:5-guanidino-2-oxopentanoate decarboxylase [Granulosicoccus sp.]
MKAGEYLTRLLACYGVDCVFGIPGVHTLELYRALDSVPIRHVSPRHEQAAGFMADGYARRSGKPGVCFIISGPGMTNCITAMGQAYADSVPMLVVSTVNSHGRMGSGDGWLHELPDQSSLVSGVCAFSHTVHDAREITQVVARAFAVFDAARPRPVHIEIPINVLNQDIQASPPSAVTRIACPVPGCEAIQLAAQWLAGAELPVLLAGGGARHAHSLVTRLAELIDAPTVMTVNGRGIVPAGHPLAVGASASLPAVRHLLQEADVVLAIGTELGATDYDFNEDGGFHLPGRLIRIDVDVQQMVRTRIPELPLAGDAQAGSQALLDALLRHLPRSNRRSGMQRVEDCRQQVSQNLATRDTHYLRLLEAIRDTLPGVCIVGDSTQIIYAGNSAFASKTPSSYFNSATGFGTLGYALPAAIGAVIADSDSPVVAIIGDGGLQFSLAELSTAIDAGTSLLLIVHRNGGYAEIRKCMRSADIQPVGVDLMVPELSAIASACHWQYRKPLSIESLVEDLHGAQDSALPTLVLLDDELFN